MKSFFAVLLTVFMLDTTFGVRRFRVFDYNRYGSRVRTWEQARAACRKLGRGWDLVKIDDRAEDNAIKTILMQECTPDEHDGWFIGGKSINGRWRWADYSRMTYSNFPLTYISSVGLTGRGRPQSTVVRYAVIFKRNFQWGSVNARQRSGMGYICEIQCSDHFFPVP
ncbi:uncharacterized protein LOC134248163 isoform X2 [Saccostrea cucullata]|uniref:uncharacterized protein LOC134248163 isoform X2 n=1 Tax=Saccostrea cuccullata TaxID=36930 RepID=UPI002ED1FC8A